LIQWWLGQVMSEREPAERAAPEPRRKREPRVWVQTVPVGELKPKMRFRAPAAAEPGNLLVVFADDEALRWPAAIFTVERRLSPRAGVQQSPTGLEIRGALTLSLARPRDAKLRANQQEIESYAKVGWERDTRELGIHDDLLELLLRFADESQHDQLRQLFGRAEPTAEPAAMPVVIELPERISTAGVLGTTLARGDDLLRFRNHRWGPHDVRIVTEGVRPDSAAIRIRITCVEVDPRNARMEFAARLFMNRKEPFYDACARAALASAATELIQGPRRGRTPGAYDLELVVNRVPHVSPAHAYRRGVQWVTAALDALDAGPGDERSVAYAQVRGASAFDLVEAQRRLRELDDGDRAILVWIDPETGVVELRFSTSSHPRTPLYERLSRALGERLEADIRPPEWGDPFYGRFGVADERGRRRIAVELGEELARVTVRATDDRPVLGYVTFYTAVDGVDVIRVRAHDGVARCELTRRERTYAVGAVIEDEGIVLEHEIYKLARGPDGEPGRASAS
jgi:hypothetical protein